MNETTTKLADLLVPFAEAANVRVRDVSGTLRKRILLALPFADTEGLHAQLFPKDDAPDWAQARAFLAESPCSTDEWLQLLALLHFLNEPATRPHVAEMVGAASAGLRVAPATVPLTPLETLQLCFARAGFIPTWDLLCKSLLCANLADVDVRQAVERLLERTEALPKKRMNPAAVAETVLRHLPAHKHSRDEYTQTFARLLAHENCHVASHYVLRSLKAREEAQARTRRDVLASFHGTQKPSLTRLLLLSPPHQSNEQASDSERFCRAARLPVSASPRLLQTCYYVACLPDAGVRADAFQRLFPDDDHTRRTLQATSTPQAPDFGALLALVNGTQHFGEPCAALRQFRQLQQRRLQLQQDAWTPILRLFLAAHCPGLWPHVVAALPPAQQHSLSVAPSPAEPFPVADVLPFFTAAL